MANNFQVRPIRVDSVMAQSWKTVSGFTGQFPFYPKEVYWENPVTVGDTFQIQDPIRGSIALEGRCETANQSQLFPIPPGTVWTDFTVITIVSGILWIWGNP